jgi:hypothetical protein
MQGSATQSGFCRRQYRRQPSGLAAQRVRCRRYALDQRTDARHQGGEQPQQHDAGYGQHGGSASQ